MKITINITDQTVTENNQTCNFFEAGLTTNADPVEALTDRDEIEEYASEKWEGYEIVIED